MQKNVQWGSPGIKASLQRRHILKMVINYHLGLDSSSQALLRDARPSFVFPLAPSPSGGATSRAGRRSPEHAAVVIGGSHPPPSFHFPGTQNHFADTRQCFMQGWHFIPSLDVYLVGKLHAWSSDPEGEQKGNQEETAGCTVL